jgi:hypothetical protein
MKALTVAVYALFGLLATAAGFVAYVRPAVVLPSDQVTGLTAHLTRELSSAFIFIGLMFFWCLRHYTQRRPVHLAFLVFSVFFAGAHWPDSFGNRRELVSILINSVPVALLAITAPFGRP